MHWHCQLGYTRSFHLGYRSFLAAPRDVNEVQTETIFLN
jgi:hypothetical protein